MAAKNKKFLKYLREVAERPEMVLCPHSLLGYNQRKDQGVGPFKMRRSIRSVQNPCSFESFRGIKFWFTPLPGENKKESSDA